jgi:hypothetical protein
VYMERITHILYVTACSILFGSTIYLSTGLDPSRFNSAGVRGPESPRWRIA